MMVVLDTNIWISGLLLPKSQAGKVLNAANRKEFEAVTTPYILAEIKNSLSYKKIQSRMGWGQAEINRYISLLQFSTFFIDDSPVTGAAKLRDEDDAPILAAFINSNAEFLVTGDKDLLCLRDDYQIITLREFIDLSFI